MSPRRRFTYSDPLSIRRVQQRVPPAEGGSLPVDEVGFQHVNMLETPPDEGSMRANEMETPPSEPKCSSVGSTITPGQTRGIRAERFLKKKGKLPEPIHGKYREPVGRYANSYTSAAGIKARKNLPEDKFDLHGHRIDVKKAKDTKLGERLHDWSHRWKYLQIKDAKGENFANPDQWTSLINHKCNDSNFQILTNAGQPFKPVEFYRTTHYNDKRKKRAAPTCESKHEGLKKRQEDHCSQSNATQLTAEELPIQVLGARSGCLKGLGMRPSSSFKTTAASSRVSERLRRLEERIQLLEAANQSQTERKAKLARQMASMFAWMRRQGYTGEGDSSGASGAS